MSKYRKTILLEVIEPLLKEHFFETRLMSAEEKEQAVMDWKKQYVPKGADIDHNLWHTFSYELFPHVAEDAAIRRFEATPLKSFVLFSTYDYAGIHCVAPHAQSISYQNLINHLKQLPNHVDIFLAQHHFKWTFVVTHEDDCGPYYAVSG